jgi:isoquinoline 1-oxidoreductase subunit beta
MKLQVNGDEVTVDDRHEKTPLLWVLRDELGMHGTKFGCGGGFCGACTVMIDGKATKSCQTKAGRAIDKQITTVDGASGPVVDAVREAWYEGNVPQCGYCQPGQTMAAISLLESDPEPDDDAITLAMNGNLCRCGTYQRIQKAIHDAAEKVASGEPATPLEPRVMLDAPPLSEEELADPVHPYVRIHADGGILVYCSQIEMGQGVMTGLATIVAEELDADMGSISVVLAASHLRPDFGDVYGNMTFGGAIQLTGGSTSTQSFWLNYRQIAASAKARLLAAAAAEWDVPAAEIEVEKSVLSHPAGRTGSFGEFAEAAEKLPVPEGVEPKTPDEYRLIGSEDILRLDSPSKILGAAQYPIDVTLPEMRIATVLHPPVFGAKVASLDDSEALAQDGVEAVVPIDIGVAVVAQNFADALRGLRALKVEWDDSEAETRSSDELRAYHRELVESGEGSHIARDDGDVSKGFEGVVTEIDEYYEVPYLAHTPMEPNTATCRLNEDGTLEVWASSQAPHYVRMQGEQYAGVEGEKVKLHVLLAGGAFGLHTSAGNDPVSEAMQVAKATDWAYPVKVVSPREEEFKSGRFRPMVVHNVHTGVDAAGKVTAFHQRFASEPIGTNLPIVREVLVKDGVDFLTVTGATDGPYNIPNLRVEVTNVETGIPIMSWRSVGNSHTEFARECAIDELAVATGRDQIEFRRHILENEPRAIRVLDRLAELTDWGAPMEEGRARGLACSNGFFGASAQVSEISQDDRGRIHVDRITFVLDCGIALNPDLVRAQVEGGAYFALSAALWGEVTLGEGGKIETQNFDRYELVRMRMKPVIDIHILDSKEDPGGVGEVAVPTTAPALANAIAALTGERIRRLPLSKSIRIH